MNIYRICYLDDAGRICTAFNVTCEDDPRAISEAEGTRGGATVEVWEGGRLVARFKAGNPPADTGIPSMPQTDSEMVQQTATGMIRNYGGDAARIADSKARKFAKSAEQGGDTLWTAVAGAIRAMQLSVM